MDIPFAKVDCSGNEQAYVSEVLRSGWLTTGRWCAEFEKQFAEAVGATYACAVNSATAALHLAVEALGIGPGDQVFVPALTFTASAEVLRYVGADPVFLDVEYGTCLVTPEILEEAIKRYPAAKGLMLVHFGGQAAEMSRDAPAGPDGLGAGMDSTRSPGLLACCRKHGLKLIEDAAHAFPTRHGDQFVGSFGDATCFSFYANKTITTGEGGMLVTDDEAVYQRAKTMRLHGINRDIWGRFTDRSAGWEYDVIAPGFKYNLSDVAAAIGIAQLERAELFRRKRQHCAEVYYDLLGNVEWIDLPVCKTPHEHHAWHLFWVVLNEFAPMARNNLIRRLNEAGVGTSVHYKPLYRMSYYRDQYGLTPDAFPETERHWKGCISLPIYPELAESDLVYICDTLKGMG